MLAAWALAVRAAYGRCLCAQPVGSGCARGQWALLVRAVCGRCLSVRPVGSVRIFFKNKTSCPTSDERGFFKQFILKKALMNK